MLLITHVKFHDAKHNFLLKPDCAEYHSAQSYLAYSVEWPTVLSGSLRPRSPPSFSLLVCAMHEKETWLVEYVCFLAHRNNYCVFFSYKNMPKRVSF